MDNEETNKVESKVIADNYEKQYKYSDFGLTKIEEKSQEGVTEYGSEIDIGVKPIVEEKSNEEFFRPSIFEM